MVAYVLQRWDEPHLFDALIGYFQTTGSFVGDEYGDITVDDQRFTFGYSESFTTLRMMTDGMFCTIEEAALKWYNDVVDTHHATSAENIAKDDPSFGGRPYCDVL